MLAFELLHGDSKVYGTSWGENGRRRFASDHDRLYMLKAGEIWVQIEGGATVHVVPGKLYLFAGGETSRTYRCTEDAHLCWLHSRVEAFPGLSLFTHYEPPCQAEPDFDFSEIMERALGTVSSPSPRKSLRGVNYLTQLYQPFLPDKWSDLFPYRGKAEQLSPAVSFIHSHLGQAVVLKDIASTVHLHPTYFSNLFKNVFGKSPLQYHHQQRMRWACSQLLQNNKTISEIAFNCGYDDPLYFSRQFRKEIGISPRYYRNRSGRLEP